MMKIQANRKSIILALSSIIALAVLASLWFALQARDPLAFDKQLYEKLDTPNFYSDSKVEKFNHVDRQAEGLQVQAHDLIPGGNISTAIDLLNKAVNNYRGFKGYHYFILHEELAALKKMQGDDDAHFSHTALARTGRLNLLKAEQ